MHTQIKIQASPALWTEFMTIAGGVFLLFAASQMEIPLHPVPVTLQTVAVMLIGLRYSPRQALETHLLWLGLAAAGFPVLAGFVGGPAKFVGPTAGYLVGMVIASFVMATLRQKLSLNSWKADTALVLLGTVIVYAAGIAWLSQLLGSWTTAFTAGALPFILPGLVKGGLLCAALQVVRYARGK